MQFIQTYTYLPAHVYKNLLSASPKPEYVSVLIHEQTHIQRQKEVGWIKWGAKYCFSKNFRFEEEFESIKSQMKYLKSKNQDFDTTKSAEFLSSYLYLWCVSYKQAKRKLDQAWKQALSPT